MELHEFSSLAAHTDSINAIKINLRSLLGALSINMDSISFFINDVDCVLQWFPTPYTLMSLHSKVAENCKD